MYKIQITNRENLFTLVDKDIFDLYGHLPWHCDKDGYAVKASKKEDGSKTLVKLHRLILNLKNPSQKVDHINGNKLDNRKENLRICTSAQNSQNKKGRENKKYSRYKGICFIPSKKLWVARIGFNNKVKTLGYSKNEHEAARIYNKGALKYHREYAKLNVIKEK